MFQDLGFASFDHNKPKPIFSYTFLKNETFTDHVEAFNALFKIFPTDSFLEFGMGKGTSFFISNCGYVRSIELVPLTPSGEYAEHIVAWYDQCLDLYKNCSNWSPEAYFCGQDLSDANLIATGDHPFKKIAPPSYQKEISTLINRLFAERHYDIAFVDPGIHNRGDIVNALFNKVDIIAAHDTNYGRKVYGWNRIIPPRDYTTILFHKGCGTTFWVHNKHPDVIRHLQKCFK